MAHATGRLHFRTRCRVELPSLMNFTLMLTDLHPSNMFVDDQRHMASVIDLERVWSQPAEIFHSHAG